MNLSLWLSFVSGAALFKINWDLLHLLFLIICKKREGNNELDVQLYLMMMMMMLPPNIQMIRALN